MDREERQGGVVVELADMAEDRPVAPAVWFKPPVVRIEGERLVWSVFDAVARRGQRATHSGAGMLEAFLALADGPPERVLAFAQRWGVLGLCEHHLPSGHPTPPEPESAPPGVTYCMPAGWWSQDPPQCSEAIAAWRRYAGKMRAARNIAARLHLNQPGRDEDWRQLRRSEMAPVERVGERPALAAELRHWLTLASVRPVFMWTRREPRVSLEGSGLFGALVLQLMLAVARTGLAVCTGCANAYVPARRPRPDVANYCPVCQQKGAALDAAGVRYRKAKREARRLAEQKLSIRQIAKRLDREVGQIRRWLK